MYIIKKKDIAVLGPNRSPSTSSLRPTPLQQISELLAAPQATANFSNKSRQYLDAIEAQGYMAYVRAWDDEIRRNEHINGSAEAADVYIEKMGYYLSDIRRMHENLRQDIR